MKKYKLLLLTSILSFSLLSSCNDTPNNSSSSSNSASSSSTSEGINDLTKITMKVSVDNENINFTIHNSEKKVSSKELNIIGVKAYQYLEGDNTKGVSSQVVDVEDGINYGKYNLDANVVIKKARISLETQKVYDETEDDYIDKEIEYDSLYNKYYLVDGSKIILGPIYATEIESQTQVEPTLNLKSKKGILGENVNSFKDLNCSYATINLEIDNLICPNETFFEGDMVHIEHPDDAIRFESNGKVYYFRKEVVDHFDKIVKSYYATGAHITAIVYATNSNITDEIFPMNMTYAPYSMQDTKILALNTSNQYGFEYYIATIEFLASRYSGDAYENGYIGNYVIGNEIDYAKDYNRISEKQADLSTYMEEYSRLLRLTNLACKKYQKDIKVTVPFTHAWAKPGYTLSGDVVQAYAPKEMIEWLNNKTKQEGDYDWAIAPHSYGYHLAQAPVYLLDTYNNDNQLGAIPGGKTVGMTNNYNTTSHISFSNIELLDSYLNQDELKVNGKAREVYLTESGVSTCEDSEKERNIQAGMIASIWYKLSQLDTITSFSYYRLKDSEHESGDLALFGLIDSKKETKPAYQVYKYIDSQYSEFVSKDYLKYVEYFDEKQNLCNYENGKVKSYLDLLNVFNTNYDFSNYSWSKAKPQKVETVYEFEDKEDLSMISFEDKAYIYDGSEKELVANNLPEGISVTYDDNKLTEVGSKKVLATFKRGDEVVGHREATLSINKYFTTNKTVYEYGENIFVTALSNSTNSDKDWIGIFKKGANVGNVNNKEDTSIYYYYPNKNDDKLRTTLLQTPEHLNEGYDIDEDKIIPAGEYTLYYLENNGYNALTSVDIVILRKGQASSSIDLSEITFEDASMPLTNGSASLLIKGVLPEGVEVTYTNNTLTSVGTSNACAIFFKDGVEIERRYAVLTTYNSEQKKLSTNKETYLDGENIYVTAYGEEEQWVGLYLKDDDVTKVTSIYWYYTKDQSGKPVDIKTTTANSSRKDYVSLPAGEYKLVLFADSGYNISETCYFTISTTSISRIKLNKDIYALGDTISITCNVKSQLDWVGIFASDCSEYNDSTLLTYYSPKTEGKQINNLTVNLSSKYDFKEGQYKVVLFNTGGYEAPYEEKTFEVKNNIETNKLVYETGEDILVKCFVKSELDWVGVFDGDCSEYNNDTLLTYYSPKTEGKQINNLEVNLSSKHNFTSGTYKIVVFNTGDYSKPYSYLIITVK